MHPLTACLKSSVKSGSKTAKTSASAKRQADPGASQLDRKPL